MRLQYKQSVWTKMNNNKIKVYSYVKGYQKQKNFIELASAQL